MKNKHTETLRKTIAQLKMTPITAPLVSVQTINHLLACVNELEKLAAEMETQEEVKADEDHNEPE